jgi:DNA-binding NtrC family response regulator
MKANAHLLNLQTTETINLTEFFTVGEAIGCNLLMPGLSDRHARIEFRDKLYLIKDLRSELGTFVNGTKIIEAYLTDGDEIQFGNYKYKFSTVCRRQAKILKSQNKKWNEQLSKLPALAQTQFPVLILGPSGAGKEVLAKALHQNSYRCDGPFLSVNCSALAETLIESELFGHIKGSFTGASSDRKGAFEAARGGTLFLDEIGDLPYALQAKLLRALENEEIRPVGSDRTVRTDVRILAATHQNLGEKISNGLFRSDLYYRLNVITLNQPDLRSRMEDFEDLLYMFAKQMRVRFSVAAIEKMKDYSWPGNIRELKNVVSRASALVANRSIEECHVDNLILDFNSSIATTRAMQQLIPQSTRPHQIKSVEREMIIERLKLNNGHQRRTAESLGMPKSTLNDRLKQYGIRAQDFCLG